MANLPISGLTASVADLVATDLLPVVQTAGVGPVKMTGTQIAGGLLGSTALTGATVTTSQPVLNLSQTWNNAGVAFTGLLFTATNTASDQFSKLIDLKLGANTIFQVSRFPNMTMASSGTNFFDVSTSALSLGSGTGIQWGSTTNASGTADLFLRRGGAATLQLGAADAAAPVAQTLQVQSVVTGTTNTAGANFTIAGSRGTGTGAGGSIIFQVAPAGTTGTAVNALASYLAVNAAKGGTSSTAANNKVLLEFPVDTAAGAGGQTGIGVPYSGQIFFYTQGAISARILSSRISLPTASWMAWNSASDFSGSDDVILARDAANTLALRNSTNPQTFRVYNGADTTNFQRLVLSAGVTSNMAVVAADNGGTGVAMGLQFGVALTTGGGVTNIANFNTSGHLLWNTDNTYDIGASGATRPRNGYFGTRVVAGSPTAAALALSPTIVSSNASGAHGVFESTVANSSISGGGVLLYQNSGSIATSGTRLGLFLFGGVSDAGATFRNSAVIHAFASENWTGSAYGTRLEFGTTANGGTSRTTKLILGNSGIVTFGATEANTVPALKPSSTTLQVRLGDDSANAPIEAASVKTNAPTGGTSGTWKVGVYNATAPSATGYVEVDIGGTLYKLLAAT